MPGFIWSAFSLAFSALLFPGCDTFREKIYFEEGALVSVPSFKRVHSLVLEPKCASCHGSGTRLNLNSYSDTRLNLRAIERTVFIERSMPRGGRLNSEQERILRAWIDAGAPELPRIPEPDIPLVPLEPTYASIRARIFAPKCGSCHSPDGEAKDIPFLDYKEMMESPHDLVIPGNVRESGVWISISRTDRKRMPPPENAAPLTEEELEAIKRWIESGAPEI